jgi:hypothetical protein
LRQESSKTFLVDAGEGTYVTQVFDEPVHYRDGGGGLVEIDATLEAANGRLAPKVGVSPSSGRWL